MADAGGTALDDDAVHVDGGAGSATVAGGAAAAATGDAAGEAGPDDGACKQHADEAAEQRDQLRRPPATGGDHGERRGTRLRQQRAELRLLHHGRRLLRDAERAVGERSPAGRRERAERHGELGDPAVALIRLPLEAPSDDDVELPRDADATAARARTPRWR
jgi:hypothetical protein